MPQDPYNALAVVQVERWKWGTAAVAAFSALFLLIDLAFWGANIVKVPHGGWFPLVVGALIFALTTTWKTGRGILAKRLADSSPPLGALPAGRGGQPAAPGAGYGGVHVR